MKKICFLAGWACCLLVFVNKASAQVNTPAAGANGISPAKSIVPAKYITVSGDTCLGSTLTANLNNVILKELEWYADSTMVEARSTWRQSGTIVAGDTVAGFGANQLSEPYGVAVDSKKRVYVVDDGTQRVQRWDPGAKKGVTVAGGNGKGTLANQFYTPVDVIVDKDFNVYVSDDLAARVVKWAPGATQGVTVAGGHGSGAGLAQLFGPQGICLDSEGNLYVADRWNDRVMKWAPGATAGVIVAGGHGRGPAANQLNEPFGVAVDAGGNVYVTDPYNYRVQKWAPGARAGTTVAGGMGSGNFARQLTYPSSITVDSLGNLYVLDRYRVLRWSKGANYGITVAGGNPNAVAGDPTGITWSWGMCALNDGVVYVSAIFDGKVTKFIPGPFDKTSVTGVIPGNYTAVGTTYAGGQYKANHKIAPAAAMPWRMIGEHYPVAYGTYRYIAVDSIPGVTFNWLVPAGASLVSGQGKDTAWIKWGSTADWLFISTSNSCGISPQRWFRVFITPAASAGTLQAEPQVKNLVSVYPNPAPDITSVAFTAKKQAKYDLKITDIMGKVIHHETGNTIPGPNKIDVDVSKLRKNVYLIALQYDDNSTGVAKFNKQ
jgi:sugar lactone lactonase YvrE